MTNYMKSVFVKYKFLILFFAIFGFLMISVPVALGIGNANEGYKVGPGVTKAVSAVGTTTKLLLKNVSATASYFIPTRSTSEISKFMASHPAVLSFSSCGDRVCSSSFGENCSSCPSDCGLCSTSIYTYQFTGTQDPWNVKTVGGVCGDGTCDSLIENATSCPYDCAPGCCALKGNNTIPNCGLYANNDAGDTKCLQNKGCMLVDTRGNRDFANIYYYKICGFNKNYVCEKYNDSSYPDYYNACNNDPSCSWFDTRCVTKNTYCSIRPDSSNCNNDTKCQWSTERNACIGKTSACWDSKDVTSCKANPNCAWIGQTGGSKCYNYCGNGFNDDITDTYQTCPTDKVAWSPYITVSKRTYLQCGDGFCVSSYPSSENVMNCPSDCAASSTGMIIPTNGCGDGVCATTERKGQSGYCYVDCGNIGEGICKAYHEVCDDLSGVDLANTLDGCTYDFVSSYAPNMSSAEFNQKASECSKAKNSNECNRFGCYWQKLVTDSCGNGTCTSTTENCSSCPRDCGYCQRTGFCEGSGTTCAQQSSQANCQNAGCTWTIIN